MSNWPSAPPPGDAAFGAAPPGYAPQPGYGPPPPGGPPGTPGFGPVGGPVGYGVPGSGGSNNAAVVSLVAGILGLFVFPGASVLGVFFSGGAIIGIVGVAVSVLAVVFGILGMKKASAVGRGKGLALAGLIMGIVGVVSGLITTFAVRSANEAIQDADEAFEDADAIFDANQDEVQEAFSELDDLLEDLGNN